MGVKGCGEVGTIGSPAAVANAVVDALSHLGVNHVDMPATPTVSAHHPELVAAASRRIGMTAMKAFALSQADSVPEAVRVGRERIGNSPIAGGMSLLPTMKQRLSAPAP